MICDHFLVLCNSFCIKTHSWPFFSYSFKPNEGVVIIGATNFPEALDK